MCIRDSCKISVTDNASNTSDNLTVGGKDQRGISRDFFTIGATKPALLQVTAVLPNPSKDNTPEYTFFSTLSGTISHGGSCSSDNGSAVAMDNKTISFNTLADTTYTSDNCTVRVTSNGVTSDDLSVTSFTIDTIAPTLYTVTIASNNSITTMAKSDDIITLSITLSLIHI